MNKSFLIVFVTVTGLAVLLWLWSIDKETELEFKSVEIKPPTIPVKEIPQILPTGEPKPPKEQALLEDPYQNEAIQAQLLQVADLYAETAKYPHTSQPIRDPELAKEHEPFAETEVDTPFPLDDLDEPVRLLAAVDRYQYFFGDTITTRLQVQGAPADTFVSATATVSGAQGDTPLTVSLNPQDQTLTAFSGSVDTKVAPAGLLSTEMIMKVKVDVGDETLLTTVPFRYSQASAQLLGVQYARPEAENLVIALQYSVYQSGYYFVSAILEDAASGRPLLQLQGESRLNQGNAVLILRAHSSALRAMGSEGPYLLRSIKTHRGSETGESYDVPASSLQAQYGIAGYPFDQYDDTPHHDEDAQDRIDFLENLGGNNQSPTGETQ